MKTQFAFLMLGLLASATAFAEGAVRKLDCVIERVCDASGVCRDEAGQVVFRMEPLELTADRAGRYLISYGEDERFEMQALSDLGPFAWMQAEHRHVLVVSSETQWLWHQLDVTPGPVATIRFLSCSFQG